MLTKRNPPRFAKPTFKYSFFSRQWLVFGVVFKFLYYLGWDKLSRNNSSRQRHRRAQWLVRNLLRLGPTYIKIGQALSTRADLIPLEYIEELGQLQDRVPPFNSELAIAVIESELGKSIYTLFADFESTPLASASLGQVHKARLNTGEDVVVKVQRPGLEQLFNLDLEVLHRLIRLAHLFFPGIKKYNLEEIYQEFFELLYLEIDYIHEGKNAERFRKNFQNYPRIIAPKVYWEYATKKILTLEYLPGIKIDDRQALEASNINTNEIIQLGVTSYLKQLLIDGFFQSDPHPGNMAVSPKGEIIFYDFGTMAEVKLIAKDQMIKSFFAVLRKDTDEVVKTLVYMGLIEPMGDMSPVRRLVAFLLEEFRDKPVDVKAFEQISGELAMMFEQQPFRLPPQMTFVLKAVTTLDGIARALNPQYNLLAATAPFVRTIAASKEQGNLLRALATQAKDLIQNRLNKPSKTELLIRRLESRLDTGELQLRVRSVESECALKRIHLGIKSLIYTCLSGFSLLGGTILFVGSYPGGAIALFCFSTFWFFLLLRSLVKLAMRERLDKMAKR